MTPIDVFTNPEQWFDYAETLTTTDEILDFYHETIDKVEIDDNFDGQSGFLDTFFTLQDHLLAEKRFDDWIDLVEKLKAKYHDFYQNHCFQYFDSLLLEYYLYIGDEAKAKATFELFIENPLADVDSFLPSVQLILLYDKREWVAEIAEKTFHTIHESHEIMGDGQLVGIHIFNNVLQQSFELYQATSTCDWEAINEYLKKYEYKIDQEEQLNLEESFSFDYNNETFVLTKERYKLGAVFSKYMLLEKKMSFITSYFLLGEMDEYWAKNNKKKGDFNLDSKTFDQFCAGGTMMFNPYKSSVTARLWGAQYVYDFLYKIGLINQVAFDSATAIINSLKKSLTTHPNRYCWQYGFYRYWEKADGETTEAYEAHIKHSQESFEEVDILEKKPFDSDSFFDGFMTDIKPKKELPKKELKTVPVRTTPKVGRNESCPCGSGSKYKNCCGK